MMLQVASIQYWKTSDKRPWKVKDSCVQHWVDIAWSQYWNYNCNPHCSNLGLFSSPYISGGQPLYYCGRKKSCNFFAGRTNKSCKGANIIFIHIIIFFSSMGLAVRTRMACGPRAVGYPPLPYFFPSLIHSLVPRRVLTVLTCWGGVVGATR